VQGAFSSSALAGSARPGADLGGSHHPSMPSTPQNRPLVRSSRDRHARSARVSLIVVIEYFHKLSKCDDPERRGEFSVKIAALI